MATHRVVVRGVMMTLSESVEVLLVGLTLGVLGRLLLRNQLNLPTWLIAVVGVITVLLSAALLVPQEV